MRWGEHQLAGWVRSTADRPESVLTPELVKGLHLRSGQSCGFSTVRYGCESWTVKKAEYRRTVAFESKCWRRLLRVPRTARRSNQSILEEISPEYSLEGLMLKPKPQYFGHLMQRADSFKKTLMLGKIISTKRRGQQRMRWRDGIINGHESGQTLGDSGGQGSLVCCQSMSEKGQTRLRTEQQERVWTPVQQERRAELPLPPRARAASSARLPRIALPHAFLCKAGPSFQDPEPAPQPDGHPLPLQRILRPQAPGAAGMGLSHHAGPGAGGARVRAGVPGPPHPPWSPGEARQAGHVCSSQAGEVKEPQDRQVLVHQGKWKTSNPLSGRRAERMAERRQGGFRPGRRAPEQMI